MVGRGEARDLLESGSDNRVGLQQSKEDRSTP